MSKAIISLEDVWFRYKDTQVVEAVNLQIYDHDFLGIIGPNGSGKTTLLKLILGLITPDRGRIRVLGGDPREHKTSIGYVPQYRTFDFAFPISVSQMVLTGRLGHIHKTFRKYKRIDHEIVKNCLEMMEIYDLKDNQVGQLSGGQQQKVMLARALENFFEILEKLHTEIAIVVVSHDIGAISTHVDRIACMNQKLYIHDSPEITAEMLAETYRCPVELIAHGVPHRVLEDHKNMENK